VPDLPRATSRFRETVLHNLCAIDRKTIFFEIGSLAKAILTVLFGW
jgi:hypothetical protein